MTVICLALLLMFTADLGAAVAGDVAPLVFVPFTGARDMSPAQLAGHVDVRRLDLTLPPDTARACSRVLWDTFAKSGHAMSFNPVQLTRRNQDKYWRSLAEALVDSATAKGLPAEYLSRCLANIRGRGGARLPVAAYLAESAASPVWIIIEKWEYSNERGPTEAHHIHLRAFRVIDGQLLCESKCL